MWTRIKAHLVEDWKQAYRWASVQLAASLVFLEVAYQYLPDITAYLPEHSRGYVAGAIIVARIIQQTKVPK